MPSVGNSAMCWGTITKWMTEAATESEAMAIIRGGGVSTRSNVRGEAAVAMTVPRCRRGATPRCPPERRPLGEQRSEMLKARSAFVNGAADDRGPDAHVGEVGPGVDPGSIEEAQVGRCAFVDPAGRAARVVEGAEEEVPGD